MLDKNLKKRNALFLVVFIVSAILMLSTALGAFNGFVESYPFFLILIVLITGLALLPEAQGPIIDLASKGIGLVSLLAISLIGPLFWKRATATGAITGMTIGILIQAVFELKLISYTLPYGFGSALPALGIGLLVFAVLSCLGSTEKRKVTA